MNTTDPKNQNPIRALGQPELAVSTDSNQCRSRYAVVKELEGENNCAACSNRTEKVLNQALSRLLPAPGLRPWQDQVVRGDCSQVLRRLPDRCIDLVVTDPPYLVNYKDRAGRSIVNDDHGRWLFPAFAEIYRVMKPDSYCVSFYGWSQVDKFMQVWRSIGFRTAGHFVWVKRYASTTRHTAMKHEMAYLLVKGEPQVPETSPSDVLDWHYTGNRLHPTQKPVRGLLPLIRAYSKPGDIVLDPFAGSGSTGMAAHHCGRHYLLIEQDAAYHKAALARMKDAVPARLI